MLHLVIPHQVSSSTASVWLAVADGPSPPDGTVLRYGNHEHTLDVAGWQHWRSGNEQHVLHHRTVVLQNLTPATSHILEWRILDQSVSDGSVATLPSRLPSIDEQPFTVLLGSCFCARRQESAMAGTAYFHLPHQRRPLLKFLCGDQVYLDDPWAYFLFNTHTRQELESLFVTTYLKTWGQNQQQPASGFNEVLRAGANYFSPDDHEMWNNAPNPAVLIRDTWWTSGRRAWRKAASELYRIIQSNQLLTGLAVGQLSFLVVDTRMERAPGSTTFLPFAEMDRVGEWVRTLSGPGVLVIGQPVFETPGNWFSQLFVDRNLPDYDQYADLVRHLASSRHSIVILSGDVHYGRLARCRVRDDLEIFEVIASPMALVDPKVGGSWRAAPSYFPAKAAGAPITPKRVHTNSSWQQADNHFVTLEFASVGDSVRMAVRDWRIGPSPVGQLIDTVTLH